MTCIICNATPSQRYPLVSRGGKLVTAHRLAYAEAHGLDPHSFAGHVLHSCDTPRCINPEHLFLGDNDLNVLDKVQKNRQAQGEGHGLAELTREAVRYIRDNYVKGQRGLVAGLAKQFNVSTYAVYDVLSGRTWKGV